jgi:hypothetical protein
MVMIRMLLIPITNFLLLNHSELLLLVQSLVRQSTDDRGQLGSLLSHCLHHGRQGNILVRILVDFIILDNLLLNFFISLFLLKILLIELRFLCRLLALAFSFSVHETLSEVNYLFEGFAVEVVETYFNATLCSLGRSAARYIASIIH